MRMHFGQFWKATHLLFREEYAATRDGDDSAYDKPFDARRQSSNLNTWGAMLNKQQEGAQSPHAARGSPRAPGVLTSQLFFAADEEVARDLTMTYGALMRQNAYAFLRARYLLFKPRVRRREGVAALRSEQRHILRHTLHKMQDQFPEKPVTPGSASLRPDDVLVVAGGIVSWSTSHWRAWIARCGKTAQPAVEAWLFRGSNTRELDRAAAAELAQWVIRADVRPTKVKAFALRVIRETSNEVGHVDEEAGRKVKSELYDHLLLLRELDNAAAVKSDSYNMARRLAKRADDQNHLGWSSSDTDAADDDAGETSDHIASKASPPRSAEEQRFRAELAGIFNIIDAEEKSGKHRKTAVLNAIRKNSAVRGALSSSERLRPLLRARTIQATLRKTSQNEFVDRKAFIAFMESILESSSKGHKVDRGISTKDSVEEEPEVAQPERASLKHATSFYANAIQQLPDNDALRASFQQFELQETVNRGNVGSTATTSATAVRTAAQTAATGERAAAPPSRLASMKTKKAAPPSSSKGTLKTPMKRGRAKKQQR